MNDKGYITTTLILLMIIPALLLILITIDQNNHQINQTANTIKSDKLIKTTNTFKEEINTETKKTITQITKNITNSKRPLTDSKKTIKQTLQQNINQLQQKYQKTHNIQINTTISDVKQTNDPFVIQIQYTINTKIDNQQIKQTQKQQIQLTDDKYPVYDPEPFLKANPIKQKNQIRYKNNPNLTSIYADSYSGYIIHKCPYTDYHQHANNNQTMLNCIKNHYYHVSHDGLCLFCRLENQTTCPHVGLETFIVPVFKEEKAIVSIDHVLLNQTNQYEAKRVDIDDNTFLYLDNGHKSKYGL